MESFSRQESINGKSCLCLAWCQTASRKCLITSVKTKDFTHRNREGNYVFQPQLGSVLENLAKSFYYSVWVNVVVNWVLSERQYTDTVSSYYPLNLIVFGLKRYFARFHPTPLIKFPDQGCLAIKLGTRFLNIFMIGVQYFLN